MKKKTSKNFKKILSALGTALGITGITLVAIYFLVGLFFFVRFFLYHGPTSWTLYYFPDGTDFSPQNGHRFITLNQCEQSGNQKVVFDDDEEVGYFCAKGCSGRSLMVESCRGGIYMECTNKNCEQISGVPMGSIAEPFSD